MKYAGGWSLSEAYNLPIGLRTWFVMRLARQLKEESEAINNSSKGNSGGTPLTPYNNPQMPPDMMARHGKV